SHKISSKDIYHFSLTAPHEVIHLEYLHRMNDHIKKIRISKTSKSYRVYQTNKEIKIIDHSDINYSLTQVLNLQHWLYGKPKIGDTEYLYAFDPTAASIISNKVILDTIIQSPGNENGEKQYKFIILNKNNKNGFIIFDEKARILRMALTGNMEYRQTPKTIAKKSAVISDLYIENIVPIKTTIGKLDKIEKIQLIIDTLSGSLLENASGQEVVKDSAINSYRITLDPDDDNHQTVFYDEKLAFARINKDIFTKYPGLMKKLDSVIGSSNSVEEKVNILLSFTDDIVEDDLGILSPNIDYVLKHRKGDCSEHSLMFMALAKYENIPCRIVSGLVYLGDWGKGFAPHQWNEVIIDNKWVPVDPTTRSMPIGPYYIRFPDNTEKHNKLWDHIKDMTIVVTEVMFKSSTSKNTGIDTINK
ncbi:transglutaminase-like domain-containing protein, partial [bacterium]|nr:transglutaminase-like domain-containing protein [bacterium]